MCLHVPGCAVCDPVVHHKCIQLDWFSVSCGVPELFRGNSSSSQTCNAQTSVLRICRLIVLTLSSNGLSWVREGLFVCTLAFHIIFQLFSIHVQAKSTFVTFDHIVASYS